MWHCKFCIIYVFFDRNKISILLSQFLLCIDGMVNWSPNSIVSSECFRMLFCCWESRLSEWRYLANRKSIMAAELCSFWMGFRYVQERVHLALWLVCDVRAPVNEVSNIMLDSKAYDCTFPQTPTMLIELTNRNNTAKSFPSQQSQITACASNHYPI